MCGRYTLRKEDIPFEEFDVKRAGSRLPWDRPRFNVAPSQTMPIVFDHDGKRTLEAVRWGFVPFYERRKEKPRAMINARSETAREKASFRKSAAGRRCLVPADGFYEWKKDDEAKVPHFIRLKGDHLFAFAGLWESGADGIPTGYLILTTEPNDIMAPIHDRMPVIVPREAYDMWLSTEPLRDNDWGAICRSFPDAKMEAYSVSTLVNSPRNDVAECIER